MNLYDLNSVEFSESMFFPNNLKSWQEKVFGQKIKFLNSIKD